MTWFSMDWIKRLGPEAQSEGDWIYAAIIICLWLFVLRPMVSRAVKRTEYGPTIPVPEEDKVSNADAGEKKKDN